ARSRTPLVSCPARRSSDLLGGYPFRGGLVAGRQVTGRRPNLRLGIPGTGQWTGHRMRSVRAGRQSAAIRARRLCKRAALGPHCLTPDELRRRDRRKRHSGHQTLASPSGTRIWEGMADATPQSPRSFSIFRAVWIANMASSFGGLIQSVGASRLMTSLTPSSQMVALVQASTALPILLLSLWSGAVADNLDRRRVMLAAQGFMLLVSVTLAIFAFAGWITPWLLLGFTFLIGCGAALNGPAWQASVGEMVPRAPLPG